MSKNNKFSETSASRYSLALYELAEENKIITDVEKQVFLLNEIISSSLEFKSLLKNPTSSQQDQINVLSKISDHYGFNILLKNFLCFLVEKKRLFFLTNILKNFVDICSKKRGEIKAKLIAAKQLDKNQVDKIKEELSKDFSNKIKLDYEYDPTLIGGLIIQVGSVMIDTSIKGKLKDLEIKMIGA